MESKGYLKSYITHGVHQVKILKLFDIKEAMNTFSGNMEKSRGATVQWADDIFTVYFKEKDFYMLEEGVTLMAMKEIYKDKPYIKWNVSGDVMTQRQNIGAPKMIDKEKGDVKAKQYASADKERELSIVTQSMMHIPGHFTENYGDGATNTWEDYCKLSIGHAKELLKLVKEDLNE